MRSNALITFEGTDGAGKTTISKLVYENLSAKLTGLKYYERKTLDFPDPYVKEQMCRFARLIWAEDKGSLKDDPFGSEFWILLLAAWFSALQYHIFDPARRADVPLVIESWYYRLICKLAIQGHDRKWLHSLFKAVREPDIVVLIDIDPELSWGRRKKFSEFEKGSWAVKGDEDENNRFRRYQGAVREELYAMAVKNDWVIAEQKEGLGPEVLAASISERVLASIRERHLMLDQEIVGEASALRAEG